MDQQERASLLAYCSIASLLYWSIASLLYSVPMHEVGIARNVIDAALAAVPDGGTLTGVTVSIGPMSAVVADSLRFGFEVASKDTPAEGAELEIVETPLVVHCDVCDKDSEIDDATLLRCPDCGGGADVVSGNETAITSVRYDEA